MSLLRILLTLVILLSATPLFATPLSPQSIPEPLKPWVPWVLERDESRGCAEIKGTKRCVWYRSLALDVNGYRGSFTLSVDLDGPGMVKLPGDDRSWPQDVRVTREGTQKPVAVFRHEPSPYVQLDKGSYQLTGSFKWNEPPPSLLIPPEMVTIQLTFLERPLDAKREADGRVWLRVKQDPPSVEQDTLSLSIARRLQDGIPFLIYTHVTLKVTGRARQVVINNLVPKGALYLGYESPLRAVLLQGGETKIDVTPGVHTLVMNSLYETPPDNLKVPERVGDEWPQEEYWSWSPNTQLRRVELEGGVEANSFELPIPEEWRTFTTFALRPGSTLAIKEVQRGSLPQDEKPNYSLHRTAWLTSEGDSFDILDTLHGQPGGAKRLEAEDRLTLKRLTSGGKPVMISHNPATRAHGIELRSHSVNITAEGSIGGTDELPAIGWNAPMASVRWALHLPPGWILFSAKGPDWVNAGWWHNWELHTVLVTVVVLLGLWYFYSWGAALAGAIILLVPDHRMTAALVGALALGVVAILLKKKGNKGTSILNAIAAIWLLLAMGERLFTLFLPHLSMPRRYPSLAQYEFVDIISVYVNGSVGALLMVSAFLIALVSLGARRYRPATIFALIAVGVFFARSLVSTHFNDQSLSASSIRSLEGDSADYAAPPQAAGEGGARREYRRDKAALDDSLKRIAFDTVDPLSLPQAGEGVPQWEGKPERVEFGWEDGLSPGEEAKVKLTLISPLEMKMVGGLQLVALLLLTSTLLRAPLRRAVVPLALLLIVPTPAHADDYPPNQLLNELEQRLTADKCKGECLSNPRLSLSLNDTTLTFEGEVHSRGITAYPLPTVSTGINLTTVEIDGVEAPRYRVGDIAWVRVPDGIHTLRAIGTLLHPSYSVLRFHLKPGYFTHTTGEWSLSGLDDSGNTGEALHLSRAVERGADWRSGEQQPATWYRIRRFISLGSTWRVRTFVDRNGDISKPDGLEVALLRGEVLQGARVPVRAGIASVSFVEKVTQVSWEGELPREGPLELLSHDHPEEWTLFCEPTWRCSYSSSIRVSPSHDGVIGEVFHPVRGEKLIVNVERPEGVEGSSKAIISARLQVDRKKRERTGDLHLAIRSNKRDSEIIVLPKDARVTSIARSGEPVIVKQDRDVIRLPLEQGEHDYSIQWSEPRTTEVVERLPVVRFESFAKNIEIVTTPDERWIVWLEQRGWGPFVGWWQRVGAALIVTLVVLFLERRRTSLLWFIPFLGVITIPSAFVLLIPLALVVLTLTKERAVGRIAGGVAALAIAAALVGALGATPEMSIVGQENGPLRWFLPERLNEIPSVAIISLPTWGWKVFATLWAASAVLFVYLRTREVPSP